MKDLQNLLRTRQAVGKSFDVAIVGITCTHFDLCNGNDCIS